MASRNQSELPRNLARARDRLTAWRRTKKPRSQIPQRLWELAVKLAAEHGLHRTAQALRLNYYSLKKRGEAAEGRREGDGPAFIEFPPALAAVQECVIDLEDGAMSLRVQLKGYSAAEIATVGRSVRDTR